MAYKIQTSKARAFLLQDAVPLLGVLVGIILFTWLIYINVAHAGEKCAVQAVRVCSVERAVILLAPGAVLFVGAFFKMLYNLFKIGTVSKANLKYRDFSGVHSDTNEDVQAALAPKQEAAHVNREQASVTQPSITKQFPYGAFVKVTINAMPAVAALFILIPASRFVRDSVIFLLPVILSLAWIKFTNTSDKVTVRDTSKEESAKGLRIYIMVLFTGFLAATAMLLSTIAAIIHGAIF